MSFKKGTKRSMNTSTWDNMSSPGAPELKPSHRLCFANNFGHEIGKT